ncbi:nitroreductase [Flavobacteriaceae bacterium F89]|uniref:Putative NAD(P)H nitroreductase n=1 Tax=Cerina litoralis TaxID=2874477 RepID=A0AAE3JP06_9FLAO|nr:nitroreductase [Cerina litoralis]MCG2460289.1 nitroreductase [Cerina litoralis]
MIFDIIKRRRSVFPAQYNNRPIVKSDIEKILEAANYAPTHKRTEPWRFKVLQGESKDKLGIFLAEKYKENDPSPKDFKYRKLLDNPKKSGAVIAICMQRDQKESLPEWEELASTAMAVQNMWLRCTEMGIGCYWSSTGLIKYMDEFFDLKSGEKCLGFFYMGHYDEEVPVVPRGPVTDKVIWL